VHVNNNQQQQQQIEQNQPLKSKPGFVSYIITNNKFFGIEEYNN
jgi:hypothetical protein